MRRSEKRTAARKSSRKGEGAARDQRGRRGENRRVRRKAEGGKSRILTERWGMSRRVVCSHGSSLSTAVQYAGQGKVTLLCVRARARARLLSLAVPHTIARIRHYTVYDRSLAVTLS